MPSVRLELTTFRLWDWRANQLRQEGFYQPFKLKDQKQKISPANKETGDSRTS